MVSMTIPDVVPPITTLSMIESQIIYPEQFVDRVVPKNSFSCDFQDSTVCQLVKPKVRMNEWYILVPIEVSKMSWSSFGCSQELVFRERIEYASHLLIKFGGFGGKWNSLGVVRRWTGDQASFETIVHDRFRIPSRTSNSSELVHDVGVGLCLAPWWVLSRCHLSVNGVGVPLNTSVRILVFVRKTKSVTCERMSKGAMNGSNDVPISWVAVTGCRDRSQPNCIVGWSAGTPRMSLPTYDHDPPVLNKILI